MRFSLINMHFLQSKYWKAVKKNLGNNVVQIDNLWFQTTKLPLLKKYVGYIPRIELNGINWNKLNEEAKKANCIYITVDPSDLYSNSYKLPEGFDFDIATPIQLQNNIVLNLEKSSEEMLAQMKQKHRYNLNLAAKKGVVVDIDDSEKSFEHFLKLHNETAQRQQYFERSPEYLKTVWQTLKNAEREDNKKLVTIATAFYNNIPVASWMIFLFDETIYYPYGGSSDQFRNVMGTYALVWGVIEWGKEKGYKNLDFMGVQPNLTDGYSRFKAGFGGNLVKYEDSVNLVIDPKLYLIFNTFNKLRKRFKFLNRFL